MKNALLVLTASVVALLVAELLSLVYIGTNTKRLFYSLPVVEMSEAEKEVGIKKPYIHPYFGSVNPPEKTVKKTVIPSGRIRFMTGSDGPVPGWVDLKPNNHGFWSSFDYPLRPGDGNSFIVGVFGGSVAQWLSVQAGSYLQEALAHLPGLEGKQVYIVNLALGGYKQPQQLQVLSYFMAIGQHFDLIINLDGFNEVALPVAENLPKGVHYSLPRSYPKNLSSVTSIADAGMVRWLNDGLDIRENISLWRGLKNQRLSATFYLVATVLQARYQDQFQDHMIDPPPIGESELGIFFTLKSELGRETVSQQEADMIDLWERSSLMMHDMAERIGAVYVHVLQPNQYHSGKKFSAEERRIALKPDHPYSKAVERLYPVLLARSRKLTGKDVHFIDATPVFDDEDAVLYADTCCHYNDLGYRILIDSLVYKIGAILPEAGRSAQAAARQPVNTTQVYPQ